MAQKRSQPPLKLLGHQLGPAGLKACVWNQPGMDSPTPIAPRHDSSAGRKGLEPQPAATSHGRYSLAPVDSTEGARACKMVQFQSPRAKVRVSLLDSDPVCVITRLSEKGHCPGHIHTLATLCLSVRAPHTTWAPGPRFSSSFPFPKDKKHCF